MVDCVSLLKLKLKDNSMLDAVTMERSISTVCA
jgi:hypothetical protein